MQSPRIWVVVCLCQCTPRSRRRRPGPTRKSNFTNLMCCQRSQNFPSTHTHNVRIHYVSLFSFHLSRTAFNESTRSKRSHLCLCTLCLIKTNVNLIMTSLRVLRSSAARTALTQHYVFAILRRRTYLFLNYLYTHAGLLLLVNCSLHGSAHISLMSSIHLITFESALALPQPHGSRKCWRTKKGCV